MKPWSFFIVLILDFLVLKNCQCNEKVDIISTLPNEILTEIVQHVGKSTTDDRSDFLSRARLSAVSRKFNDVVKATDHQFYHLKELEEVDQLEEETRQFIIIFADLANYLIQIEETNDIVPRFIIQFMESRNPLFDLGTGDWREVVFTTGIKNLKENFEARPACFPEAIRNSKDNKDAAEKLVVQKKRGLNLFQDQVKKFLEKITYYINCLGYFKKTYEEEAIKIYLMSKAFEDNPWCDRSDSNCVQEFIVAIQPFIENQMWEIKEGKGLFALLDDEN